MTEAQSGIIPEPSAHARFLVLRVGDRGRDASAVARAMACTIT